MRNVTKEMKVAFPALVAAGFATLLGVSPVKGDFLLQVTNPEQSLAEDGQTNPNPPPTESAGLTGANAITKYSGVVDDYVLSALNTGTNGTGSTLTAVDVTITVGGSGTTGAIVFDTFRATSKTASAVSVNGLKDPLTQGFGDPLGGTYVGIGSGSITEPGYDPQPYDPENNPVGVNSAWNAQAEYNNGTAVSGALSATKNTSSAGIDPNFINNTVHTFELAGILPAGSGTEADSSTGYVPFANIVIPTGVTGSITVQIGGEIGSAQKYTINFPAPAAPVGPTISLSTSAPVGSNLIASATLSGGHGSYVAQTFPVTGAAQTNGYLAVSGWTPGDEEVYGLDVAAGTLSGASITPSGGTLEAVTTANLGAALANLLASQGDNFAVVFPTGSGASSDYFSYNTQGSATITSITVVPEPTGIGALVLGGIGLMSRRKARKIA
jgi:hypothetical protein